MKARNLILGGIIVGILSAGCGSKKLDQTPPAPPSIQQAELPAPPPPLAQSQAPLVGRPVTDVYGNPIVQDGEFYAESKVKPWSSWWFPSNDSYLFAGSGGRPGPLEKYDAWVKKVHGTDPKSANFERENLYDPMGGSWEGLCDAWARAAVLEVEPVPGSPSKPQFEIDGVTFSLGDLKALMIKSYEGLEGLKQYGQRNNGFRGDDFDDLYPDQFHRALQAELFENERAIIMDVDPGVQIWNTPIWAAEIRVRRDSSDAGVMHVETRVASSSVYDASQYDLPGSKNVVRIYTYDLHGAARPDGSIEVLWGVWTGPSQQDHPDFISILPTEKVRFSRNKALNIAYIDEILTKARTTSRVLE